MVRVRGRSRVRVRVRVRGDEVRLLRGEGLELCLELLQLALLAQQRGVLLLAPG